MRGRKQKCGKFGGHFQSEQEKPPKRFKVTLKNPSGEVASVIVRCCGKIKIGEKVDLGIKAGGPCEVVGVRRVEEAV